MLLIKFWVFFPKDVVFGKPGEVLVLDASPGMLYDIAGSTNYPEFRLESDHSICSATDRLFKVGDIYVLSQLKKLVVLFGLISNFVVSRSDASLKYNRIIRSSFSARKPVLTVSSSIVCGCDWCIRFNWDVPGKRQGGDKVKITYICGLHTNTYDPSNVDYLVLARTRASSYKKCTD